MYGCRQHNARDNVDILRQTELFGRVLVCEKHDRILVDLLPDDAPEIVDRFIARDRPMLLEFFFMCVE